MAPISASGRNRTRICRPPRRPPVSHGKEWGFARDTVACDGTLSLEACPACREVSSSWRGCGDADCTQPGCQKKRATRRARRAWDRLAGVGPAPWASVVLTLPPAARSWASTLARLGWIRQRASAEVAEWIRVWSFAGRDVRTGGFSVWHPEGDTAPGSWAPHMNVVVPLVGLAPDGRTIRGRFKLPPKALDDLRRRWGAVLAEAVEDVRSVPHVHYSFRTDGAKKRHLLRYVLRSFPGWDARVIRVVWWGKLARRWMLLGEEPEPYGEERKQGECRKCGSYGIWTWGEWHAGRWRVRWGPHERWQEARDFAPPGGVDVPVPARWPIGRERRWERTQ